MSICKARLVSDVKNYKLPFLKDTHATNKYYHLPISCMNESLVSSDLCGKCLEKEKKLKSCTISNNSLKGSSGRIASHPSVLHGRMDEKIPSWSHLINGEWFKSMLIKGYTEMPSKVVKEVKEIKEAINETKVMNELAKLTGKNSDKVAKLLELFPSLNKSNALSYVMKSNKLKKSTNDVADVIEALQTKLYINPEKKEEAYEIVKVSVKPITVNDKKYFYDSIKDKIYDIELNYVGRYKAGKIYTDFPDSDKEP